MLLVPEGICMHAGKALEEGGGLREVLHAPEKSWRPSGGS